MKLNHINLAVGDVLAAREFLQRHFGLRPVGEGHKNFQILLDEDGFVLTLMGVGRDNTVSYPKTFHIGFIQPSDADVDAIHQRLKDDGLDIEPPSQQHGAWSFSFQAPGGFTIVIRTEVDWQAGEAEASATGSHSHRRRSHGRAHR
jgi:catechol 2,3-dioxygenase-like lactoylglutathione lyase family enzyme